jgi:hypothetical protein
MVNGSPLSGVIPIGSTVNDTAALVDASPGAGGTLTYYRFSNLTCSGTSTTQQVTVTNASVPPSTPFRPLAGNYSYRANYNGDGVNLPTESACEPFEVGRATADLSTTVFDALTNTAISSPVPLGVTVYDTATLTTTSGVTPTGTVTYTFYQSGDCTSGTVVGMPETVPVGAGGSVPHSGPQGPLTAATAPYAFQAQYSGDANFVPGDSDCEPFTVAQGAASLSTTVFDALTNTAISSPVPLGATVYDTSTLTTTSGLTPTGTVTYTFYRSGDCTGGTVVGTPETVTVGAGGSVPHSSPQGPLTAATAPYAFQARYSGDVNFVAGSSECEPFTVAQEAADISTTVFDAVTNAAIHSPVPLGATVYDTTTLTASSGVTPKPRAPRGHGL